MTEKLPRPSSDSLQPESGLVYTYEQVEAMYYRLNPNDIEGDGFSLVVADSSAVFRRQLVESLRRYRFTVYECEDGMAALQSIKEHHPDLAILDNDLSRVSGGTITEALKRDPVYGEMPVIFLSSSRKREEILLAHQRKVAAYIVKPCQIDGVIRKVAECLKKTGQT